MHAYSHKNSTSDKIQYGSSQGNRQVRPGAWDPRARVFRDIILLLSLMEQGGPGGGILRYSFGRL